MIQAVMSTFHRYINSNQNIELDNTFEVFFKIVSGVHVNYSQHRRKAIPLRTLVGHRIKQGSCFQRGGILDLPKGTNLEPNCFENQCLLLCLIFQLCKLSNPDTFEAIKPLVMRKSALQLKIAAAQMLKHQISQFCTKANISAQGPYDLLSTVQMFSELNCCQVIVISSMDGATPIFHMFPNKFDLNLPRIYLFNQNNHVVIINNLMSFWKSYKKQICFGCKKFYYYWTYNRQNHKCSNLQTCYLCSGILKTNLTVINDSETFIYCDSSICTSQPVKCQKCNNNFQTKTCFENHWKKCSRNAMPQLCSKCNLLLAPGKDVLLTHDCGVKRKFCRICFQNAPVNHICSIVKQNFHSNWPIVGVLAMAFKGRGSDGCEKCFVVKSNFAKQQNIPFELFCKDPRFKTLLCQEHKEDDTSFSCTNAISIWVESQRFLFEHQTFTDDILIPTLSIVDRVERIPVVYCDEPLPFTNECPKNNKIKGPTKDLIEATRLLPKNAETKLLDFIVSKKLNNTVMLVENDQVMFKLLDIFLSSQVQPHIIQKGSKLFCLELTQFGLKFINFQNYAPGTIETWLEQFQVNLTQPYFPELLNNDKNLSCNEPMLLNFDDFVCFGDTDKCILQKQRYFDGITQPVCLKSLMLEILFMKSRNLLRIVTCFMRETFSLQRLLNNVLEKNMPMALHPFGPNIVSCPSLIHSLCQYYILNDFNIAVVKNPLNCTPAPVSIGEYEFTSFMSWKYPDLLIENAFNNPRGQRKFGKVYADAYSPISKTIYSYSGCFHHCHDPAICLNKKRVDKNPDLGQKKREIDEQVINQTKLLFPNEVLHVQTTWECQWLKFKKENKSLLNQFWTETDLPQNRPLIRLVPKASVRGGFLETYKLKCLQDEATNITWVDCNSMYTAISLKCDLPIGNYKILTYFDLKNKCHLNEIDGQFYFENESMKCDIAMVEILVPSNLKRPFLSYRIKDEFVFMANCRSCADLKSTSPCKHSDKHRSFTSTWTVCELAYAVQKLNYKIVNWLEVYHYSEFKPVLKPFVKILASEKLKSSNILSRCNSVTEKQNYCDYLNKVMEFEHENLKLTPANCCNNPTMQNYLKTCLNSLYGRFAQTTKKFNHVFCKSIHDIELHTSNPNTSIVDFFTVNQNIIEMVINHNNKLPETNRHGNLCYTAIINAMARIYIYDLSLQIEQLNGTILSIDTDSICFSHPKNFKPPFEITDAIGHFKNVLGSDSVIKAYYSLGVRSYVIVYCDGSGHEKYLTKVKGLSLNSHNVELSPGTFQTFIESRFQNEINSIFIPQCKKKLDKQTKNFSHLISTHEFSNEIHCKRFIIPNDKNYETYSYGYDFKNVNSK